MNNDKIPYLLYGLDDLCSCKLKHQYFGSWGYIIEDILYFSESVPSFQAKTIVLVCSYFLQKCERYNIEKVVTFAFMLKQSF